MDKTVTFSWSLEEDFDNVVSRAICDLSTLDGKKLLVTGGTGFIGRWLLEILRRARNVGINVETHILTRNPAQFAIKYPQLSRSSDFYFHEGEIVNFDLVGLKPNFIFHAATAASAKLNNDDPFQMFDTALMGTRHILNKAAEWQSDRMLLLSSGAIYGRQPTGIANVSEIWTGAPDCTDPVNAYAEAKRGAELLCAIASKKQHINVSIARIFSILGPMLELNSHFAAGNFLADAMGGRSVDVHGDGRAVRSYIYPTDLLVMLLALLIRGPAGRAYNVGSTEAVTMAQLADRISKIVGTGEFEILGKPNSGWNAGRYIPDNTRIISDFNLAVEVGLDQAIINTALSYGWQGLKS